MLLDSNEEGTDFVEPIGGIVRSQVTSLAYAKYYYDNPLFDHYELASVRTTWDVPAVVRAVQAPSRVLDLGGGDGRLVFALEDAGLLESADVVDVSRVALDRCRLEAHRRGMLDRVVTHEADMFDLPDAVCEADYDVVLFGDVALHYVYTRQNLDRIMATASGLLRSDASLIITTSFDEKSATLPRSLAGVVRAVPHRGPDGIYRLFLWAFDFDTEQSILKRSVFVETGHSKEGLVKGVVSDLRDRLWKPSEIDAAARSAGLRCIDESQGAVEDGAVEGAGTAICVFGPDPDREGVR